MPETEFNMPKMGESITEGTIINWLVEEGASFETGDILVEVATDKVDNEVPAPGDGVMTKHLKGPKEVVPVGEPIAILELKEGSTPVKKSSVKKQQSSSEATKKTIQKQKSTAAKGSAVVHTRENVFISPLVDSMARKHHISYEELARIPGSGKDGRLKKSDVTAYLEDGRPYQFAQPVPQASGFQVPELKFDKGTGKRIPMDRMRQMIADHMVFSKHTSPHVTAYVEADLTEMVNWRNNNKKPFQEKYRLWRQILT